MIDINLLKELGDGLRSLLNLGKEDAQAVRAFPGLLFRLFQIGMSCEHLVGVQLVVLQ